MNSETNLSTPEGPPRGGPGGVLGRAFGVLEWVVKLLAGVMSGGLVVLIFVMVLLRNLFHVAPPWLDDLLRWGMIWLVYLAAVVLSLRNEHISMDAVYVRLPLPARRVLNVLIGLASLGTCLYVTMLGYTNVERVIQFNQRSNSGLLPGWVGYGVIPFSFALMSLAFIYYLLFVARRGDEAPPGNQI